MDYKQWRLEIDIFINIQILSTWIRLSRQYWRKSKLWLHQLRQPTVVHVDDLSIDHPRLLGECIQYGMI